MNRIELIEALRRMDRLRGLCTHPVRSRKAIPRRERETLEKSLARMVESGLLVRASKGVYVNPDARSRTSWILEDIALVLRRGCYSYVSLESALSEYGLISQIPMRLTVMTSGRGGTYETPYGTIEFTHTQRGVPDILDRSVKDATRPLRVARKRAAVQDLLRVGRNTNMLDEDELAELEMEDKAT